jgi:hypothetical protein
MKSTVSLSGIDRRLMLSTLAALPTLIGPLQPTSASAQPRSDPLPSWNDGATKQAITAFVARVTSQGGPDFVPVDQRIATFDNDGTLWIEQPMYVQMAFILDRVRALAAQNPDWTSKQPFQAALDGDMKALAASGEKGLVELMAVTHAGMTTEEFLKIVSDWLTTARDPRFKLPYVELVYQPMLELLAHLRTNGFKTFIVSGGASSSCARGRSGCMGSRRSRWWAPRSRRVSRCAMAGRRSSGCRKSTSSTTRPGSRSASTSISAAAPLRHSAIPTVIWRCCNGQR